MIEQSFTSGVCICMCVYAHVCPYVCVCARSKYPITKTTTGHRFWISGGVCMWGECYSSLHLAVAL